MTEEYPQLARKLILISTKSYFTPERTVKYLQDLLALAPKYTHRDLLVGLIPDFLTIYPCAQLIAQAAAAAAGVVAADDDDDNNNQGSSSLSHPPPLLLLLGAQDCAALPDYGAYTGFTTTAALRAAGVSIVELGHAERRRLAGETDAQVAAKAAAVCARGMVPLVCIGEETKAEAEAATAVLAVEVDHQLRPQIESVLLAVPAHAPVVFAYEPVWAIGRAQPAPVEYVAAVVRLVRDLVRVVAPARARAEGVTRIVYGGSAGPGLWSGKGMSGGGSRNTNGNGKLEQGLGQHVDGMFLGRFAHEIGGVEKVLAEVVESLDMQR